MVFGRGYRKSYGRAKPAQLTTNHCLFDFGTTVGGTTSQQPVFTTVEPPTNRGQHLPSGAMLMGVDVQLWGIDSTPVTGTHQCFMLYQPGATTYADPIAAWLSTAEPMTEESIQVRQHKMGRLTQFETITGASLAPYWRCRWRGRITLRDADDIVIALRDDTATDWEGLCTAWWIA